MPTLAQSLESLLGSGVRAALLATPDGLVIDAAAHPPAGIDFDSLAADVAGIIRAAGLIGRDLTTENVHSVVVTLKNEQTVLAVPLGNEAIAMVLMERGGSPGARAKNLAQISTALEDFLRLHTGKQWQDAVGRMVKDLAQDEWVEAVRDGQGEEARGGPGRIALSALDVNVVGQVVTMRVTLALGGRQSTAKGVGRDLSGQRASLAANATIRAMLELLPTGHAVELVHVQATTPAREGLWVLTRFLNPDGEQSLFGIAAVREGDEATAAAKATLNAVNRRVEAILTSKTARGSGSGG